MFSAALILIHSGMFPPQFLPEDRSIYVARAVLIGTGLVIVWVEIITMRGKGKGEKSN